MGNNNKKPEVRFKSFVDDWEENLIGNILSEKKRTIELKDNELYELITVKRRNEGIVSRGYLKGKDILVKNYTQISTGDFIISKRQVVHGANGIAPQMLDKAIVSNEYLVAIGNTDISSEFWVLLSKQAEMYKKFLLSSYGVDIEKLFFDVNDWKKRTVVIPKLPEQSQIGSYFYNLDKLITLHQNRYKKLANIKKAMLEKMFPKNGADVPKIRFKGFEGNWEEKELISVAKYRNGKAHENDINVNGEFIVVNSRFVSTNGEVKKFSNKQNEPLFKNEIAFVLSDVPNGRAIARTFLVEEDDRFSLNQRIAGITPFEDTDPYYLYILLNRNPYFLQFDDGVKQTNLSKDDVEEFIEYYPKKLEQELIGKYFKKLDDLISLHQKEFEKLKNIKKACLEKMFV